MCMGVCVIHTICVNICQTMQFSFLMKELLAPFLFPSSSSTVFIFYSNVTLKIIPLVFMFFFSYFSSFFYLFCRKNDQSSNGRRVFDGENHNLQEYTYKKITPCDVCSQVLRGNVEIKKKKLTFDKRTNNVIFISICHGAMANMIVNRFPVNCCQSIDLTIVHAIFFFLLFGRQMSFYSFPFDVFFFSLFRFEPFCVHVHNQFDFY